MCFGNNRRTFPRSLGCSFQFPNSLATSRICYDWKRGDWCYLAVSQVLLANSSSMPTCVSAKLAFRCDRAHSQSSSSPHCQSVRPRTARHGGRSLHFVQPQGIEDTVHRFVRSLFPLRYLSERPYLLGLIHDFNLRAKRPASPVSVHSPILPYLVDRPPKRMHRMAA